MAVLLLTPPGGELEAVAKRLAARLHELYGGDAFGAVRTGAFQEPFQPDDTLLFELAQRGTDDLFVFDLHPTPEAPGGWLHLVAVASGRSLAKQALDSPPRFVAALDAFCLAHHRKPDLRPRSDRFALGLELHERRRWREAQAVLTDEYRQNPLDTIHDMQRHLEVQQALEEGKRAIAREDRLVAARRDTLQIEIDFVRVAPRFRVYFTEALKQSRLGAILRPLTRRTVRMLVQYNDKVDAGEATGTIFLTVPFDPLRYWAALDPAAPVLPRVLPLPPLTPLIEEVLAFRDAAASRAPIPDRKLLRKFAVQIQLEDLAGTRVAFQAMRNEAKRPLLPYELYYSFPEDDGRADVEITAEHRADAQKLGRFRLDIPELVDGSATEPALIYRFFGLAY